MKTSFLVLNVTPQGIVGQVESPTSEGSELCFLTESRATMLGIATPAKAKTWAALSAGRRKAKGAFAKFAAANTQHIQKELVTYPLERDGQPWMIESANGATSQWKGLKVKL